MSLLKSILNKYIVSYAQFCEDIVLHSFLYHIQDGFYIDVGCSDPTEKSVTKLFYDRGWSGINIDPRSGAMMRFEKERARDINCCIGVSNKSAELPFWEAGELSTFDEETFKSISHKVNFIEKKHKVVPLNDILDEHYRHNTIHFLKIDVERHEKETLEGIDLNKYRPWMLAIESTLPTTVTPCYEDWEHIVLKHGYTLAIEKDINRFYIADEVKDLLYLKNIENTNRLYILNADVVVFKRLEQTNEFQAKQIEQFNIDKEVVAQQKQQLEQQNM